MNLTAEPQKIREILALRASGWTVLSLSLQYTKDRTSIRHHLIKYGVRPLAQEIRIKIEKVALPPAAVVTKPDYNFDNEPVGKGYTYREYLERARIRHPEERYHKAPNKKTRISDILVDIL